MSEFEKNFFEENRENTAENMNSAAETENESLEGAVVEGTVVDASDSTASETFDNSADSFAEIHNAETENNNTSSGWVADDFQTGIKNELAKRAV